MYFKRYLKAARFVWNEFYKMVVGERICAIEQGAFRLAKCQAPETDVVEHVVCHYTTSMLTVTPNSCSWVHTLYMTSFTELPWLQATWGLHSFTCITMVTGNTGTPGSNQMTFNCTCALMRRNCIDWSIALI